MRSARVSIKGARRGVLGLNRGWSILLWKTKTFIYKYCYTLVMVKLQETKDRYFITIPKEMVDQKGWKKGQNVLFLFNERGNIELTDSLRKQ